MTKKTKKRSGLFFLAFFMMFLFNHSKKAFAFPIYAQQSYENPREVNGRLVCANCHLAQKPIEFEFPTSVLPNAIFETVVKIPVSSKNQQILENGKKGNLNIGAILIMPEGFKLAPKNRMEKPLKEKTKGLIVFIWRFGR